MSYLQLWLQINRTIFILFLRKLFNIGFIYELTCDKNTTASNIGMKMGG